MDRPKDKYGYKEGSPVGGPSYPVFLERAQTHFVDDHLPQISMDADANRYDIVHGVRREADTLNLRFRKEDEIRPIDLDENITIGIHRNIEGDSPMRISRQYRSAEVHIVRRKDEGQKEIFDREEIREAEEIVERRVVTVVKSGKDPSRNRSLDKYEERYQRQKEKEKDEDHGRGDRERKDSSRHRR